MYDLNDDILIEGWIINTNASTDDYNDDDTAGEHRGEASILAIKPPSPLEPAFVLAKRLHTIHEELSNLVRYKELNAHIRYHVTDKQMLFEELNDNILNTLEGCPDTSYYHRFSDITGYLWTVEKVIINDHDIIEELYSMIGGKYYSGPAKKFWLSMKIKFSKG